MTTAAHPPTGGRTTRMSLASVSKVAPVEPDRIFIYGVEKVGKSTFGACAPNPVFISAERGLAELVPMPAHFPEAETFQDVLDAIESLTTSAHEFQTLVLDSLDWIERMIEVAVCARCRTKAGKPWTGEDFAAYGQGQKVAVEDWRKLLLALDRLQVARGVEVILIAHATTKNFDDPTGVPFTRYEPQMTGNIGPKLVKQWAKAILFARFEYSIREGEGFAKAKGQTTGRRVIYTQWSAAYDAGSRYELPPVLPLDYVEYQRARDAKRTATPEALEAEARRLVAEWSPEETTLATVNDTIKEAAGNAVRLARIVDKLRTKVAEKGNE